jgi:hypothetical protein
MRKRTFRERGEEESNRKLMINTNEHNDLFPEVRFRKENGPRSIWLNRFWCLMINITYQLICLLVSML